MKKYNRHSIRLKNYDYTQTGAYFITIASYNRECLFGNIVQQHIELNNIGLIVEDE